MMQLRTLLALLTGFGLISCMANNEEKQIQSVPNILWITSEDTSPAFGCYGDSLATTPHIDELASEGVVYTNAYASAPICAPARSCLITGMYATSLGTQHLRSEIAVPDFVRGLPAHLREGGYFTSLYGKTDYNFEAEGMWEYREQDLFPWRKRKADQPFFGMYTIGNTHEGSANLLEKYQKAVADLPDSLLHSAEKVQLPPYFPDTPGFREIWAHYYDLVSDFDRTVGKIVQALKDDGLYEETIIMVFSDHGFGLPRYKRWLNKTGLQVPLVIHVPDQYRHLFRHTAGSTSNELISFVDFAPSMLALAGMTVPSYMEGQPFLGVEAAPARQRVYGARSRADNMYEISRAVLDKQYIYIRHYFPHYPYIQTGYIFSDRKRSFRELRAHRDSLRGEAAKMWQPKSVEELYDLRADPYELHNLAASPQHQSVKKRLRQEMHDWIIKYRDTGFLMEAEMMIRSHETTPYQMAHHQDEYQLSVILEAAEMMGKAAKDIIHEKLSHPDSGVRFWAVMALQARKDRTADGTQALMKALKDPSPVVQIAAAETLCHVGECSLAIPVLGKWVQDNRPWLALQAARSIELLEAKAKPLVPILYEVLEKNAALPNATMRYKDFMFAAFTSWSLEWALHHCGEDIAILQKDMI